jgi:hypothetical protein
VAVLAEMMVERAATARALRDDHFAAMPRQQPHRRLVDLRRQDFLRAAGHQRHAADPGLLRRDGLRLVERRGAGKACRRKRQCGAQLYRQQPGEQPAKPRQPERHAQNRRARQDEAQRAPIKPVEPGPAIGLLDMLPRVIDQMHVIHARGAGRHAGQAGQAAVDMFDHFLARRAVVFQHVLDEVNSSTRGVEFIAQEGIGRTSRGAEAAMDAGAQDLVGDLDVGICELAFGEIRLHFKAPRSCGRD